jgi:hypothetical protein
MFVRVKVGGRRKAEGGSGFGTFDFGLWTLATYFHSFLRRRRHVC